MPRCLFTLSIFSAVFMSMFKALWVSRRGKRDQEPVHAACHAHTVGAGSRKREGRRETGRGRVRGTKVVVWYGDRVEQAGGRVGRW